jgi:hypothetical protein
MCRYADVQICRLGRYDGGQEKKGKKADDYLIIGFFIIRTSAHTHIL